MGGGDEESSPGTKGLSSILADVRLYHRLSCVPLVTSHTWSKAAPR